MSRPRLAALVLVVTTLAASGCGDSSGSSNSLTRSELIARADAICRRVNAKLASTTISRPQDYARLLLPLAAYERAAVAEMRKLIPPASVANGWQQVLAGAQTLADATAKLGESVKGNSLQGTPSTRSASIAAAKGTQQMTAAARREGFKDCARTP